jgi:hypothetical protein
MVVSDLFDKNNKAVKNLTTSLLTKKALAMTLLLVPARILIASRLSPVAVVYYFFTWREND